jgi:hypothetical protein
MTKFQKWLCQFTCRELAEKLGCTQAAVGIWRKGTFKPHRKYAPRLIKISRGKLTWEIIYK